MSDTRHPAAELPLSRKVEYVLAAYALANADGRIDDSEKTALKELGRALELKEDEIARIEPPTPAAQAEILEKFRKDDLLCVELLRDAIIMVFADGHVVDAEAHAIAQVAAQLGLHVSEAVLIGREVQAELHKPESLSKELAKGLSHEHGLVARLFQRIKAR